MRGDIPLKGMIKNGASLAEKITMALFGPFIIKKYQFTPNFFLSQAKEIMSQYIALKKSLFDFQVERSESLKAQA